MIFLRKKTTTEILGDIESGYDSVADKFSASRAFVWKDLEFIADLAKKGDRVLDYGCGNGRLLGLLEKRSIYYYGVDVSKELIHKAKEKFPAWAGKFTKISSQESLPFPSGFFNAVFSVAVFHHFPPTHARAMAKELFRVTSPGGIVAVTAWNLWQKKYRKYILGPKAVIKKFFGLGNYGNLGLRDAVIPFKENDSKVFFRYHRAYTEKDLKHIFSEAGFLVEDCSLLSGRNIVLVARKPSS